MDNQPSICKKICLQCPWRRASAPGFLGSVSGDPWAFAGQHLYGGSEGEHLPCHLRINWELPNAQELANNAPLCRGYVTFLRNTDSLPTSFDTSSVEPDHEAVFSNYQEFHLHHHDLELMQVFQS